MFRRAIGDHHGSLTCMVVQIFSTIHGKCCLVSVVRNKTLRYHEPRTAATVVLQCLNLRISAAIHPGVFRASDK